MNVQKKVFLTTLAVGFCICTVNIAAAATNTPATTAGTKLTVADSKSGGSLICSMSPGVIVTTTTEDNAFVLATLNANAGNENRLEYGILSTFAGYYQRANTTTTPIDLSSVVPSTTNPFGTDWVAIGDSTGT